MLPRSIDNGAGSVHWQHHFWDFRSTNDKNLIITHFSKVDMWTAFSLIHRNENSIIDRDLNSSLTRLSSCCNWWKFYVIIVWICLHTNCEFWYCGSRDLRMAFNSWDWPRTPELAHYMVPPSVPKDNLFEWFRCKMTSE